MDLERTRRVRKWGPQLLEVGVADPLASSSADRRPDGPKADYDWLHEETNADNNNLLCEEMNADEPDTDVDEQA
eukprot:3019799-Heterocapsa_arctica.AAC.1